MTYYVKYLEEYLGCMLRPPLAMILTVSSSKIGEVSNVESVT